MATTHLRVRDARDRLLDLLGIGQTYPLRDLAVRDEQLTVAVNTAAKIPIEYSQKGVLYQLHHKKQLEYRPASQGKKVPIQVWGKGETILLETYKIEDNITFQIHAVKWTLFGAVFALDPQLDSQLDSGQLPDRLRRLLFTDRGISFSERATVEIEEPEPNRVWMVRDETPKQTYIIIRQGQHFEVYRSPQTKAYLHQTATVKVGLDTSLKAWIRVHLFSLDFSFINELDAGHLSDTLREQFQDNGVTLPAIAKIIVEQLGKAWAIADAGKNYLIHSGELTLNVSRLFSDPTAPSPIIHYGTSVEVEIENSQEGVDYKLVYFANGKRPVDTKSGQASDEIELSEEDILGDLHDIVLRTHTVPEDIDIHIRATKTFDPDEKRDTQTDLLDVVLPLIVRANPALAVSVEPASIIDFNQLPTLKIADTQQSATYQLYKHPIPDRDFVHATDTDKDVIRVSVDNAPDVQALTPPRKEVWELPQGYTAWGEAQSGTGGELQFTIEALTDESLIIVQAAKTHQVSQDSQTNQTDSSSVQLEQAAVILVRPDPAPPLRVKVLVEGAETSGDMRVLDGQPGVFYHFRRDPDGDDLGLPAYFHKRDDQNETVNKGLDQLKIGVDFVIARALPAEAAGPDPAQVPPQPPLLETGPLPTDTSLHVHAVKAQTRVGTPLAQTAHIAPLPEIRLQDTVVDYGASTKILVIASLAGDRYQPLLDGEPLKRASNGNGKDLSFNTDALIEDIEFEVLVTRPGEVGIVVERVVKLRATVRPEAG